MQRVILEEVPVVWLVSRVCPCGAHEAQKPRNRYPAIIPRYPAKRGLCIPGNPLACSDFCHRIELSIGATTHERLIGGSQLTAQLFTCDHVASFKGRSAV